MEPYQIATTFAQLILSVAGTIGNVYLIFATIKNKIFLQWKRNRISVEDLRLLIVSIPYWNLMFFLYILIEMISKDIGFVILDWKWCLVKLIFQMFAIYGQLVCLLLMVRQQLESTKMIIPVSIRLRLFLEILIFALLFVFFASFATLQDQITFNTYSNINNCHTKRWLKLSEYGFYAFVLLLVTIVATVCKFKLQREDSAKYPGIIHLSSIISYLYAVCWFPLVLYLLCNHSLGLFIEDNLIHFCL